MAAIVSSKDVHAMCNDSNIVTGIGHQHNHMSVLVFLILVLYGLLFLFLLFLFCIGPLGPDEGHSRWQGIRCQMLPICDGCVPIQSMVGLMCPSLRWSAGRAHLLSGGLMFYGSRSHGMWLCGC